MTTPTPSLHFGPAVTEADFAGAGRAVRLSFGGSEETVARFVERFRDELFVVRAKGSPDTPAGVLAAATLMPMGHALGGRMVPQMAVRAVAVPPESRGLGLATGLMREVVRWSRDRGVPLTSLYASTRALYRKAGYEIAGERVVQRLDPRLIATETAVRHGLSVRAMTASDHAEIRAVYDRVAPNWAGWLDRCDSFWLDILQSRKFSTEGVVFTNAAGAIDAYAVYALQPSPQPKPARPYDIQITDAIAQTPEGWGALVGFIAGFGTLAGTVTLATSPVHPLRLLTREAADEPYSRELWMTRVTDLPRAIAARGYAVPGAGPVRLRVTDSLIPENTGVWEMGVIDGAGCVQRLADDAAADAAIDIARMGPLYTGYLSAEQMAALGWITGSPDALRTISAMFAGPAPGMPDMF